MCLAIPYGKNNRQNEPKLWHAIRTSPLYLLGFGAMLQLFMLAIFWLASNYTDINLQLLTLSRAQISSYIIFNSAVFIFFALSMHFYPRLMPGGKVEYLYFGGYFYLTLYNSLLFYLAIFTSTKLMIISLMLQLLLLLFAFKPLWWAFYWSERRYKMPGYIINAVFIILLVFQTGFIFSL